MKFLPFFLWVIFALLGNTDPNPTDQNQCGSGSKTLVESRIRAPEEMANTLERRGVEVWSAAPSTEESASLITA